MESTLQIAWHLKTIKVCTMQQGAESLSFKSWTGISNENANFIGQMAHLYGLQMTQNLSFTFVFAQKIQNWKSGLKALKLSAGLLYTRVDSTNFVKVGACWWNIGFQQAV